MANVIGFHKKRIGGKIGYDQSLITAITQRLDDAMAYEDSLKQKTPQKPLKQPQIGDYYTYNGERDNVDYDWEKNESRRMIKRININESQLHLIVEGNDNEKRARNYIRQSGICYDEDKEKEEARINQFFNYIRNVFASSDSKSYAYRHIQGITKLVLGDGTPNNPGALLYKNGRLVRSKDGMPQIDTNKIFSLIQRVQLTAELENSSNTRIYDNSFRRLSDNSESNFDDFVNANSLPSRQEYLQKLIAQYGEFKTPTGYVCVRIPSFSVATMFAPYFPACYMHAMHSYIKYGGDNRFFLFFKNPENDTELIQIKKKDFRGSGRMNDYALSAIGIGVWNDTVRNLNYELVTINSRYEWTMGSTNYDYDFNEASNILGFDVKGWLMKEFNNPNVVLNLPDTRRKYRNIIKQLN